MKTNSIARKLLIYPIQKAFVTCCQLFDIEPRPETDFYEVNNNKTYGDSIAHLVARDMDVAISPIQMQWYTPTVWLCA